MSSMKYGTLRHWSYVRRYNENNGGCYGRKKEGGWLNHSNNASYIYEWLVALRRRLYHTMSKLMWRYIIAYVTLHHLLCDTMSSLSCNSNIIIVKLERSSLSRFGAKIMHESQQSNVEPKEYVNWALCRLLQPALTSILIEIP